VLLAQYGAVHGRLKDGSRSCSMWWREIVKIREGGGSNEGDCLSRWLRGRCEMGQILCFGMIVGLVELGSKNTI